jgi:hypothetical protein
VQTIFATIKLLILSRFWAFFYVQHRHDIREFQQPLLLIVTWTLTQFRSPCSKLYNRHNHFLSSRDVDDLGLLRYAAFCL